MISTNVYLASHEVKVRVILSYGPSHTSWVSIWEKGSASELSFFCDSPESALNLGQAFVTAAPRSTLDITDYKGESKADGMPLGAIEHKAHETLEGEDAAVSALEDEIDRAGFSARAQELLDKLK